MKLIKHKDSIVVNLDQVTHIELAQTASEYHIVFYHHFSCMLEEYKNIKENFHESIWYFSSKDDRDKVYNELCSKYVELI
jgi:hypothetical protein